MVKSFIFMCMMWWCVNVYIWLCVFSCLCLCLSLPVCKFWELSISGHKTYENVLCTENSKKLYYQRTDLNIPKCPKTQIVKSKNNRKHLTFENYDTRFVLIWIYTNHLMLLCFVWAICYTGWAKRFIFIAEIQIAL